MKKPLGIIRKIDALGRVVIPKEVRDVKGWNEGTSMEMFATEEGLFLRQYGDKHEELVSVLQAIVNSGSVNKTQLEYLIDKYSK
jgi:AbrB family looped-hinge helix DNA binding protein